MSNPRIPRKPGQPANSKKHSDLYTDENPKGTIHGLGFKDIETAKASVTKIRNSSRSHAHKIQAAVAMEQRAREMGKTSEAAVYRKYINSMKKKTKKMSEAKENGRCSAGQYFCYTDKVCKSIPKGFMVDPEGMLRKENGATIDEEGLRDWFKGSKSKDGKGGWVNVVTGGTCASDEPGEGTPKCVSSAKRASMTPAERKSAARRKKAADPGQQQKSGAAKPTYVPTDKPKKKMNEAQEKDHEYSMARSQISTIMNAAKRLKNKMEKGEGNVEAWVQSKITKAADYLDSAADYVDSGEMKTEDTILEVEDKKGKGSGKKDACYHKVKARYDVWPSAYASGALVKCRKKGAKNWGNSTKKEDFMALPEFSEMQIRAMRNQGIEVEVVGEDCWDGYEKKGMKTMFGKRYPNCVKKKKTRKEEVEVANEGYAPGDVDQKVGAVSAIPKSEQDAARARILAKAKAKREKMKEENESVTLEKANGKDFAEIIDLITNDDLGIYMHPVSEAVRIPSQNGNLYLVTFTWRGKMMFIKIFFPQLRAPTRFEVEMSLNKVYPGARVRYYDLTPTGQGSDSYLNAGTNVAGDGGKKLKEEGEFEQIDEKLNMKKEKMGDVIKDFYKSDAPQFKGKSKEKRRDMAIAAKLSAVNNEEKEIEEGAAWTKKSGKNPSGGLNEKGRKSYERENPGSDLKAPSKKVGNKRRASFCARMRGMRKRQKPSNNTGEDRLSKSLRAWNC